MTKIPKAGHTQPTEQEAVMRAHETLRLIETFRPLKRIQAMVNDACKKLGCEEYAIEMSSTGRHNKVLNWSAQGSVPYHYAHILCTIPEVKKAGFTVERLRPDVKEWHLKN